MLGFQGLQLFRYGRAGTPGHGHTSSSLFLSSRGEFADQLLEPSILMPETSLTLRQLGDLKRFWRMGEKLGHAIGNSGVG